MKRVAIIGLSGRSLFYDVDELPRVGETLTAISLHEEVGGKGYNQAIACKRFGIDVSYLTAVGNDAVGKECLKVMQEDNVQCFYAFKDGYTASASILRDKKSRNEVIVYPGVTLDIKDLKTFEQEIIKSDCLLVTYEIPLDVLKKAIEIAKDNHKLVILNPAPFVYDDEELIRVADVITPNEVEVADMLKIKEPSIEKIKEELVKQNYPNAVITLGSKGCLVYENKEFFYLEGKKVKAVDSTGAGDVFNAALTVKVLEGLNLIEASKFANEMASLSVTKPFVLGAIPKI